MRTQWQCPKCKIVMTFETDVAEEDFKCSHCGNRHLMPVKKNE